MTDTLRTSAADGEAPVNPYSLREAVNSSSDTAHTGWLIFIGLIAYLLIAVAGVTHKDLLLSSDIQLPVLQVKIDLLRFFLFAPIVIVLFHLGVVAQLVMLAKKTLEFDRSIRLIEVTDRRTHPLRLELDNFFFVQAIAGPERSRVMSVFLHAMSWLTLVFVPVLLLLYVQVVFLPYHDVFITFAHRLTLAFDIALLILIGVFLTRPEESFLRAFFALTREHPMSFALTSSVLVLVAGFSFLVATIPGEALDRIGRDLAGARPTNASLARSERAANGFVMPFIGQRADGTLFGIFERNLNVTDSDLVVDKDVTPGEQTLVLRGRDLRFARLDRTDLHQADLTGADLEGASLIGADLRGALMQCADLNELVVGEDRQAAKCPSARRANLTRAKLKEARMAGIDLRGARLEDADLEGAELTYANLAGASFYGAHLERADITGGVMLIGANFSAALMQGADLTGAKLQGAYFTSAGLQGAILAHARLHGANLRDADLEGADLYRAKLFGADMKGASLKGASLREAVVWETVAPDATAGDLADLGDLAIRKPDVSEAGETSEIGASIDGERLRTLFKEQQALLVSAGAGGWSASFDGRAWAALAAGSTESTAQDTYKTRLTAHLTRLGCKPRWADGSVATGLAKRAQGVEFRGDPKRIFDGFRVEDCPASKTVSRSAMRNLGMLVDTARGN